MYLSERQKGALRRSILSYEKKIRAVECGSFVSDFKNRYWSSYAQDTGYVFIMEIAGKAGLGITSSSCPLCALYARSKDGRCASCPVAQETGIAGCKYTPWEDLYFILARIIASRDASSVRSAEGALISCLRSEKAYLEWLLDGAHGEKPAKDYVI